MQGLSKEDTAISGAALKSMKLFVTTLLEICQAQRRLHTTRLAAAVDGAPDGVIGQGTPSQQPPGLQMQGPPSGEAPMVDSLI